MDIIIKVSKLDTTMKKGVEGMFERLRKLRTEKGISALKMTEILGLATEGAYYKKETGAIKFSLLEAKAVADFFDMSIEDIFFVDEVSQTDTSG